jgi:hypothetical protein
MPDMTVTEPQRNLPEEEDPESYDKTANNQTSSPTTEDVEKQSTENITTKQSAFKGLGWLDRFLAVWIFLAMAIGIILGNFVESTGPALQKGKFVGVSIPIGTFLCICQLLRVRLTSISDRSPGYDVSHSLQSAIRISTPCLSRSSYMDPDCVQYLC